ncbi:MAG: histidine phosphatase family protein [Balneolaceae bacterium]|nr:histidine phosphatase family protein [Balneolaceae bacterium]
MSEIRLFIARHGETEYNRKGLMQGRGIDAPLNKTGIKQAEALAGYLNQYQVDLLATSTLIRAMQTAEIYQKNTNVRFLKNSDLDEMNFGDYEGVDYNSAINELGELVKAWQKGEVFLKVPGGESPGEVFERADAAVQKYIRSLQKGTLVLVVHGRLIRILLSEWLGYGLKNMEQIEHTNGAVNQLIFNGKGFEPVYLNKTDHLKNLSS